MVSPDAYVSMYKEYKIKNDLLNERIKEALSLLEYQNKEPKIK